MSETPEETTPEGKDSAKSKKPSQPEIDQKSDFDDVSDSIVEDIPIDDAPMPIDASEVEELVSEPFEDPYLQVVPDSSLPESQIDEGVQGSFWEDASPIEKLDPGEETPLLHEPFTS